MAPHLVLSTQRRAAAAAALDRHPPRPTSSISLAATSGVHTAEDVIKLLLAGADVTMTASALYKHGPGHIRTLLDGLRAWLEEKEYVSVEQMKGSLSQVNCPDPAAFERANYIKTITSYTGVAI